ncbi:MAG: response regulator transcription factor [Chloroflexi bacterium]|nr:response regulator transcription factor [Chloroflexota bacterium]
MGTFPMRVLIVDDHTLVREGIRAILDSTSNVSVVAVAENGNEAIQLATDLSPDVILMDISMPGLSGIETTKKIVEMGLEVKIIGLTVHENQEYFFRMLAAGANGYILKGASSSDLIDALRTVHEGGTYLSPVMAGQLVGAWARNNHQNGSESRDGLTTRELEVLRHIANGNTNREVADQLHLSVNTIQTHRAHIMRKLQLDNRHQLIRYAISHGFVDEPQ